MLYIAPHIDGFGRIVVIREISLVSGDLIRQIGGTQYDSFRLQMGLIPGKRIFIKRITAENVSG